MRRGWLMIWLMLSCLIADAQATFTATVSKNKLSVTERFQYVVTITNGNNPKDYRAPSFSDFNILGGPNQSSSFQSINGSVTQSVSFSYILQPKSTGKFTIGAAYVKVGDKTLSTQPVTIEVTNSPAPTAGSQSGSNSTNNNNQGSGSQDIDTYLRENILIKTEISDREIYQGESFNVTLKLCIPNDGTIYGPRAFQNLKTPAYDGFYAEDKDIRAEQFKLETINGKSYKTGVIKETILTPQRSGNLILDPFTIDALFSVQVKKQRSKTGDPWQDMLNDFFNDPFMGASKDVMVTLASKTTSVNVLPLPGGAPDNFNGAVGKFAMRSQISGTTTRTDEPLTYRITITGNGNLQLFNAPQLTLPPGWETYDPKVSESSGQKVFEYLLVPRSPGKFEIPAFSWSYFDPSAKKYQTLTSEAYPVEVTPGPGYNPNASNYAAQKEKVETLANDIRFIDKNAPSYSDGINGPGAGLVIAGTTVPLLASGFLFLFFYTRKRKMRDVVAYRAATANAAAKKRLVKAAQLMQQQEQRAFYDETIKALWGYLSDKLHIPNNQLSKDTIQQVLEKHAVSAITISSFLSLLDTCEIALYAPAGSQGSMQETYDKASAMISSLENELK